jgi:DNA mismatch repair protein MutH
MERKEAIEKLKPLKGKEFHKLAKQYNIEIKGPSGRVNKGWAGHVIERFLGLPLNSAQSPNFGSWELKVIPLKRLKNGKLTFKETMAITMIDPVNVVQKPFEESHLYSKLRKIVAVARTVGKDVNDESYFYDVFEIDLSNPAIYDQVKEDYESVRNILKQCPNPYDCLTKLSGKMGVYIQPRTKGRGHGSISRAFYARKNFLKLFLNLDN